jgi:hypothetical protein
MCIACQHISSSEEGLQAVHKFFQHYLEAVTVKKIACLNCLTGGKKQVLFMIKRNYA